MSRRAREGEVVCRCKAYRFPHRKFGGRCTLHRWVRSFFDPWQQDCFDCNNLVDRECQCETEIEAPSHCPALRDYIRYEEIRLYGKAGEMMRRSQRRG